MGTHPIFESDFDCLTDTQMIFRLLSCWLFLQSVQSFKPSPTKRVNNKWVDIHIKGLENFCFPTFCTKCREHIILTWGLPMDESPLADACKAIWIKPGCCFSLPTGFV